ncbi:AAA family ATPase [Tolypothrix sp. PCC 7910]|uniref:P-loop NTPase fold protein n=1 Tax=Tolypothrix sp. PCC 7910 TaxID=2099387 RepID=UPI0014277169|nr:P-loop NTPase fold protein [Tolypothrix sp. PCC 7910]QIR36497.1 AAA family ATPase [Tolypothrix sp. PCC 7910]
MVETKTNSEYKSENTQEIFADNPLTDPVADRLGYAPFAQHLADSICNMNFAGGFVITLYGNWGFGKSTLLNFLVHYLKEKPEDEQPIIVDFNPWLVTGDEDITKRFVRQLQMSLSQFKAVPKGFRKRIGDFIKAVSEIPVPYAQAGKAVVKLFDNQQKDISELKEELEESLEDKHPRIVVTIDDIDRLNTDDIMQLFRLLKAMPTFDDVVYVLAFNREVVHKIIADNQGIPGDIYLEKIIQAAFELPIPEKTLLRRLLFEKLNTIFSNTPKEIFDFTHWSNIYFSGIDHFINTTRDIVRLINILTVTYPVTNGEVNPADVVAIESLRVFCPVVYEIIRKNPQFFAGYVDNQISSFPTLDELKHFHNSWLAQLKNEDKAPIQKLVLELFPKLESVYGDNYYGAEQENKWHEHLRICSLENFYNYFRLALTTRELPDSEVKAILSLGLDAKAFADKLIEIANERLPDGTTKVRVFLEQLDDYSQAEIPLNNISAIVEALIKLGDHLQSCEDKPYGMFDLGNDVRIKRIISHLLHRLNEQERFEIMQDAN